MARNRNESDIRETPEWREADLRYGKFHTWHSFSIFGAFPAMEYALGELDQELAEILQICPQYFPAWFHRGEYLLRTGNTSQGEEFIDNGFNHMVNIIQNDEELKRTFAGRIDNLEKLLRYDLAVKYLEKAIRLFPDIASFYDELSFYILQLPDRDNSEALKWQKEALALDTGNDYFVNNLGWIYLMMGNFHEAKENFQKAMELNPDNPTAWENLETAEYMEQQRITFFEYLLRPAHLEALNDLFTAADFEGVAELCQMYNADRREAFKIYHLQKKDLLAHEILNILSPFKMFMDSLEKRSDEEFFLYENMELLLNQFKYLLYQFITYSENVDEHLLADIGNSLPVFYGFLQETRMITNDQYKRFVGIITPLIKEFSGKIDQFNQVRYDVTLNEAEREKIIEQLFDLEGIIPGN